MAALFRNGSDNFNCDGEHDEHGDGGTHAASAADAREGAGRVRESSVCCVSARCSRGALRGGAGAARAVLPARRGRGGTARAHTAELAAENRGGASKHAAFELLCKKYDVNAKLLELEELVHQAEETKLRAIAREDDEINEEDESAEAAEDQSDATQASALTSPDAIVRAERLRVMEQEKRHLQLLLLRENAEIEQLDASVGDLHRSALEQVERLQSVVIQVDSARQFVKDYASHS